VVPIKDASELAVGNIVLCSVRGNQSNSRQAVSNRQQSRRHQWMDRRELHFRPMYQDRIICDFGGRFRLDLVEEIIALPQ